MSRKIPGQGTEGTPGCGAAGTALANGIERLGPSDSQALAGIHALSFETAWNETALYDLLSQDGVFALGLAGAGFIVFRVVADEAEILTLATEPGHRRQGLGRQLVEAGTILARQAGVRRFFLEVAQDNEAALALYARCGFSQVGHRRGYYRRATGTEVDAQVLALELNGHLPTA